MYSGRKISNIFWEVLDSREVYVSSPWITGEFAEKLFELVKENKAKVVTSLDRGNEFIRLVLENAITERVIQGSGGLGRWVFYAWLALLVASIVSGVFLLMLGILLFLLDIIIGIILARKLFPRHVRELAPWVNNIRVSPPQGVEGFIHAKLYIGDRAYIGSANMTYSSWAKNVEILIPIDRNQALDIFNYIWNKGMPISLDIINEIERTRRGFLKP